MPLIKMTFCRFFSQGFCRNGDSCKFIHEPAVSAQSSSRSFSQAFPALNGLNINPANVTYISHKDESSTQATSDSRSKVACKFFLRPGGCRNGTCPYLHSVNELTVEDGSRGKLGTNKDEASSGFSGLCLSEY